MNKYKTTYPGLEDMIITKEELVEIEPFLSENALLVCFTGPSFSLCN